MPEPLLLSLADLEAWDPGAPDRGREQRFLCPLPACRAKAPTAAHRSLSVNRETGAWCCHRCGGRGRLREWWEARPRSSRDARRRAALRRAFSLSPPPQPAPASGCDPSPAAGDGDWRDRLRGMQPVPGTPGEAYLQARGIPIELAQQAAVRFHADWSGRPAVLFPIYDRDRALVACHGRYVDGREDPKARTAGPKSLGLFATPGAWEAPVVAIAEAPLDALSLAACGLPALALAGTSWPEWLPRACAFRRVLLATDADAAGDAAAQALAVALPLCGARVERLRPVGVKDWNEGLQADAEGLRQIVRAWLQGDAASSLAGAPNGSAAVGSELLSGAALIAAVIEIFDGGLLD